MQLVLICREQDFNFFGQENIFQSLIKDLKDLEVSGVILPDGQVFLGTLTAICGDNLGSHCIGGFVENFSKSLKFCRYCNIDRETFREDPLSKGTKRTVESYKEHAENDGASSAVEGIKFDSFFCSVASVTFMYANRDYYPVLAMTYLKVLLYMM